MTVRVLLIAEQRQGCCVEASTRALSAACALSPQSIDIVVVAEHPQAVAEYLAKMEGVSRVWTIAHPYHAHAVAQVQARQIAALHCQHAYTHVFAPATAYGKELIPVLAALLEVNAVTDLLQFSDPHTCTRALYSGSVIATVCLPKDLPVVATIKPSAWQNASVSKKSPAPIADFACPLPECAELVHVLDARVDAQMRADLPTASRVIAGGRALGSATNFSKLFRLADCLNAAVGASRAAVDAGYADNALQIGQTGRSISPELYIAIGISGAIQHICGIQDAGVIVAINSDPQAQIFQYADLCLVAEWESVLPALEEALRAQCQS